MRKMHARSLPELVNMAAKLDADCTNSKLTHTVETAVGRYR